MSYTVTQLDGGFSITANGKTETFTEKFKLGSSATRTFPSLARDKDGKLELAGRGYYLLSELGLFDPGKSRFPSADSEKKRPTVESILAGASPPPGASSPPPSPKAAAPVTPMSPALAQAIVAAAQAGHLMPKAAAVGRSIAALSNETDTPDVVADRINGKRPAAHTETLLAKFGWDTIIDKINAETRSRKE